MLYGVDFQYFRQPEGDLLVNEVAIISFETDSDPAVFSLKATYHWRRISKNIEVEISIFSVTGMVYFGIQVVIITKNWVHLSAKRSRIHIKFTLLAMRRKNVWIDLISIPMS